MPSSSFKFLSLLAVVLAAASTTTTVSAQSTLPPPQFTAIFTGQVNASTKYSTAGPFGTRDHPEASGGTMFNATTGEVVANIISFSDNGVTNDSGLAFPSGIMPLIWNADGHFASLIASGVGPCALGEQEPEREYLVKLRTDSPRYSWMNGKFLIMQADIVNLAFIMYEKTSSGAPASS